MARLCDLCHKKQYSVTQSNEKCPFSFDVNKVVGLKCILLASKPELQ